MLRVIHSFCFVVLMLLVYTTPAFALSAKDIALGGIQIGNELGYIEKIYGVPKHYRDDYSKSDNTTEHIYFYGDSIVLFTSGEPEKLIRLIVGKNNGFTTPAGIHVGSTIADLKQAYGSYLSPESNIMYVVIRKNEPIFAFTMENGKVDGMELREEYDIIEGNAKRAE